MFNTRASHTVYQYSTHVYIFRMMKSTWFKVYNASRHTWLGKGREGNEAHGRGERKGGINGE